MRSRENERRTVGHLNDHAHVFAVNRSGQRKLLTGFVKVLTGDRRAALRGLGVGNVALIVPADAVGIGAGAGGGVTVCAYAGATIAATVMAVSKRRFKWSILLLDALSYGVREVDSGIGLACPGAVSGARRGSFGSIGRRTGAFIGVVRT